MKPAVDTLATLSDKQQGILYVHFPTDRAVPTTSFGRLVVDHWLEQKIAQITNAPTLRA